MALIDEINSLCLRQLGRLPNLENPTSYNDKIQWLKLYDQQESQIVACDKVRARFLAPQSAQIPLLSSDRFPMMVKTNHESGVAVVVHSKAQQRIAVDSLMYRLKKPYGIGKGEWAYRFVEPKIFIEDFVPEAKIDYKFHCVHGKVSWIQVIWDRQSKQPKECILLPDGTPTDLHMDEKMIHVKLESVMTDFALSEMTALAEQLSNPYRYVRVDLYWAGKPLFGELTFWPRAGCYKCKDEPIFGEMLDIDMSYKYEPICP